MPVTIRISLAQQQTFELTCGPQSRPVDWKTVESLAATADRDYFGDQHAGDIYWAPKLPQLIAQGRSLYEWLDGPQGWLRTGLVNGETALLLDLAEPLQAQDLKPATELLLRKLAHLPWELLHDGKVFLAEHGVQPVRLMHSRTTVAQPANRPLRLLFMATSPENVDPVLNYEREETTILQATEKQPIDLVVEESGAVSQLQNLVASFEPNHFDVFHITGHGMIYNGTPQFLTEDDPGGVQYTTAEQLAEAFGRRWPRLLFLSGCHTAQAPNSGTIPAMAHALVNAGADAVLGWTRPVYDATGIFAATRLYRLLSTGEPVLEAVASTRREMLAKFLRDPNHASCSDWHLLRIYQGVRDTPALVTPLKHPKREKIKRKLPETEFLDAEGNIKVASDVFGRRRETQRCLKALADPGDYYGVFLHGIGGYGKSTIAARLCRRHEALNPGFERVVLIGPVDEDKLRQRLSDKFGGIPEVIEILNQPKMAFKHQLTGFFKIIEGQDRRLLLVLDDFEQNIPQAQVEHGSLRLVTGAWSALDALCFALEESGAASRLILTCRYYSEKELPSNRLFVEGLSRMAPTDIGKKTQALVAGIPEEKRDRKREERIVEVSDGNPRLLEWLMKVARGTDVIEDDFLDGLGREVAEFRENILAEKLLAALSEPERKALARMTLFQLPVPMSVVEEMAQGATLDRAVSLGLLEKQITPQGDLYRVTTVLEPQLESALNPEDWNEAARRAAHNIYKVWWDDADQTSEVRGFEVVRTAIQAREQELAVVPANYIATLWVKSSRYQGAVALCGFVLEAFDDYRLHATTARAEFELGNMESANSHYQIALSECPPSDEVWRSWILHNFAGLEAQQGHIEKALELWRQALKIQEHIGDEKGKTVCLSQMADVIARQGNNEQALEVWQKSLEILDPARDAANIAATLHHMACVISDSDHVRALDLWRQSLEIMDRDNEQAKATVLSGMADVMAEQGDIDKAQELWQESLEIDERIGYKKGIATTLASLASAAHKSGNHPRRDQLYQQAASALGAVRAYPALITVLANLGSTSEQDRAVFAAQAAWLVVTVEAPVSGSVDVLHLLFSLVPQGERLRPLLAASAAIIVHRRGKDHPQRKGLLEQAANLLSIAARNCGIQDQDAFDRWVADNQFKHSAYVFPTLRALLEQMVGDRWLFDRTPLQDQPH